MSQLAAGNCGPTSRALKQAIAQLYVSLKVGKVFETKRSDLARRVVNQIQNRRTAHTTGLGDLA